MCYMILSIFFPILAGIFLLVRKEMKVRKHLLFLTGSFLVLEGILVILAISLAKGELLLLFNLTDRLPILFKIDEVSIIFSALAIVIFLCAGFFSFEYMKHEEKEKRYYQQLPIHLV